MQDEWEQLVSLLRSYAVRKYGQLPTAISIHLAYGQVTREPIPLLLPVASPPRPVKAPASVPTWASGPEPKITPDGRRIYWPGLGVFAFTPKQRRVVRCLWDAFQDGTNDVSQTALLVAAESDCDRVRDLFHRNPAWGTLIVKGSQTGTFRLAPLPNADPADSGEPYGERELSLEDIENAEDLDDE